MSATSRPWFRHPAVLVASLLVCFPVFLVLVATSSWSRNVKGAVVAAVLVVVGVVAVSDPVGEDDLAVRLSAERAVGTAGGSTVSSTSTSTTATAATVPPPAPRSAASARFRVDDVIDGDTIRVAGGARVRLIGIDAPERGECGHDDATAALAALILGRDVVLVPGARDDVDRYGRLLRYVEVDGRDANLEMIRNGRAVARYDSRDGYGRHDREDLYIGADAETPNANVCGSSPPPPPPPPPQPPSGAGGGVYYPNCAAARAAGAAPIRRGEPGYRPALDRDDDGIACE